MFFQFQMLRYYTFLCISLQKIPPYDNVEFYYDTMLAS